MTVTPMQQRRGTSTLWTSINPIPHPGEICVETDTTLIKVGDGSHHYNDLPYTRTAWSGVTGKPAYVGAGDTAAAARTAIGAVDLDSATAGAAGLQSIPDAAGEWWCHPLATVLKTPYTRTVAGAIGEDGMILACERNHVTGVMKRVELEISLNYDDQPDDHNVPAIWCKDGHRSIIAWTRHGGDGSIHARVSDRAGSVESFATAATQVFSYPPGVVTYSYTQIIHIPALSNAQEDAFWLFSRHGGESWSINPFTIEQRTGVIAWGEVKPRRIVIASGYQLYLTIADDYAEVVNPVANQTIRFACYPNPDTAIGAGFDHAIWYFEMDCVTGKITSPDNPSLNANWRTNVGLPIDLTTQTPRIANTGGSSRRLFSVRPGPDSPAIAYADWTLTDTSSAVYKVHECADRTPDQYTGLITRSIGYATLPSVAGLQPSTGFIEDVDFLMPTTVQAIAIAGKYLADASGLFRIGLTSLGYLTTFIATDVNASSYLSSSSAPMKALLGQRIKIRLAVNPTASSYSFGASIGSIPARNYRQWYSTDGGTTWVAIGSASGGVLVGSSTVLKASTDPLNIPAGDTAGVAVVYAVSYMDRDGTVLASADFVANWARHAATYTDPQSKVWGLAQQAVVGRASLADIPYTWSTKTYGNSGAVIGHSYYAGMAFEKPSRRNRLFVASTDGTTETLTRYDRQSDGSDTATVVVSLPTVQGRIARPYPPVTPDGDLPYDALYNIFTRYVEFTDYLGSSEVV